jgi:hypothetical protein
LPWASNACRLPAFRRFGALLVVTGVIVFLATLAEASSPELHALGRIAGWFVEPLFIHLILAFPSGRLRNRVDRAIVAVAPMVVLTLLIPPWWWWSASPNPPHGPRAWAGVGTTASWSRLRSPH